MAATGLGHRPKLNTYDRISSFKLYGDCMAARLFADTWGKGEKEFYAGNQPTLGHMDNKADSLELYTLA